jgi:phosphoribosylaminoimidazole-succinocarboxamide synthase
MDILYEGKSKLVAFGRDETERLLVFKDDATAFDGKKRENLAGKGALNAAISHLLYGYLEKNGVATHLIEVVDEVSAYVKSAKIIMVEVIVRNVAAGSFSRKYGVPEGTELRNPTVEFSLKDDALGDPLINESHITALGLATAEELRLMAERALRINALLSALFMKAGIRLVDFKLEFGRCGGEIILCDELSPDSCRLWDAETNKKLDKDRFRRDLGGVLEGYADVLERLRGIL